MALTLSLLWTISAALLLLGYRPGGPYDLGVGLAAILFVGVALAGLVWPPVARSRDPFVFVVALGAAAALLLIPSIAGVVRQLQHGGPQTVLPSREAIYPWALALLATAIFGGIGIARRLLGASSPRRRRLATGAVMGACGALLAGMVFGAVAIANEVALADQPMHASRYGPVNVEGDPPACGDSLAIPVSARLRGSVGGTVDRASIGDADLAGPRNANDFQWTAAVASDVSRGRYGAARVSGSAWAAEPGLEWVPVAPATVDGLALDRRFVLIALSPDQTAIAQDLGLAVIGGARARHCRIATDGAVIKDALPIVRWIVGDSDIARWRGEIDYFVFLDGAVGVARGSLSGEAFVLGRPGLLGALDFELDVLDRGQPITVEPPV